MSQPEMKISHTGTKVWRWPLRRHTLACGIERSEGRFWLSPVMFARKFRVEGLLTVFSLILGWGWDQNDPFSLFPRLTLKRKVYSSMLDQSVTFAWCGFAVVTHICTETTPTPPCPM